MFKNLRTKAGPVALALLISGCSSEPEGTDLQGVTHTASNTSPWVVVNYWAEWCDTCREEIPELNALHQADNTIQVWGVDFDSLGSAFSLVQTKQRASDLGIEFPVLRPGTEKNVILDMPAALPASYIVDIKGQVRKKLFGPQTQSSLEREIGRLKN